MSIRLAYKAFTEREPVFRIELNSTVFFWHISCIYLNAEKERLII